MTKKENNPPKKTDQDQEGKKKKTKGKKYQEAVKLVGKNKFYSSKEAVKLAKKTSKTTFDGNLEAHLSTTTTGDLGELNLPHFKGAKKKSHTLNSSVRQVKPTPIFTATCGEGVKKSAFGAFGTFVPVSPSALETTCSG